MIAESQNVCQSPDVMLCLWLRFPSLMTRYVVLRCATAWLTNWSSASKMVYLSFRKEQNVSWSQEHLLTVPNMEINTISLRQAALLLSVKRCVPEQDTSKTLLMNLARHWTSSSWICPDVTWRQTVLASQPNTGRIDDILRMVDEYSDGVITAASCSAACMIQRNAQLPKH